MFAVCCSPRASPLISAVAALSPARSVCTPRSPVASRLPARGSPRTVCPACDPRQEAKAFNQPLSWDTSSVNDMRHMFGVRYSPRPAPKSAHVYPLPCTLHTPRSRPGHPREAARASHLTPLTPSLRLGRGQTPVRRQQAAHPLRVGGHPGLRLRWLWLRLGAGKLRLKPSPRCACGRGRVHGGCLYHSPQYMCVAATPTPT